jgi:predicted Zn-dependent peptidase
MKSDGVERTRLKSGLTVITQPMRDVRSVSLGLFVRHGAREERPGEAGLSHFLEHMLFKGTETRDARQIVMEFEDRGGTINAATSKETISVLATVLDEDTEKALEVIGDMLSHPRLDAGEIEREKGVILEEYRALKDSPEDYVLHLLFESIFQGHPLSKEVVGTPSGIRNVSRRKLLRRWREVFNPNGAFLVACGQVQHDRIVSAVRTHFHLPEGPGPNPRELKWTPNARIRRRVQGGLSQVHVSGGVRIPPYDDPRRYIFMILNAVLGAGMSSRLFFEMRERRGLVYSVTSFLDFFQDHGVLGFYYSLEKRNLKEAQRALLEEFRKIHENGIDEDELERVKNRARGAIALSQESTANRMLRIADCELFLGKYILIDETLRKFQSLTRRKVNAVIDEFLVPENFSYAVIGPERVRNFKP